MRQQPLIPNIIILALLLIDGLLFICVAIFAYFIGIDPNPGWGASRYVLMALGVSLLLGVLYFARKEIPNNAFVDGVKTIYLFGHIWLCVFMVYAWFITYGNFTTWDNSTRYYAHQADAFNAGHLYLKIKPNIELAEAADPYDPKTRPQFDDEIWDMSLYKGKLYTYWGPIPALLMMPFQARSNKLLPDIYSVFFFFCVLFVVNSLIILKLRQLFFSDIPLRNVVVSIFLVGFILPVLWSLNIPEVYEAAIGAGQFFLMGGVYFFLLAMTKQKNGYLFLAGLFLAGSVGSRAINVFSVIFVFIVICIWIIKSNPGAVDRKKTFMSLACLSMPLVVGAIFIGWYNWARFDSPFEFGLRYQITIHNLNRDMPLTFLPDYFLLNFYAYVLQPFEMIARFPFVQPVKFSALLAEMQINSPKLYGAGPVVGMLFYGPFLLLAFLPFFSKFRKKSDLQEQGINLKQAESYLLVLLAGSFLINFMLSLFFFYGQMRYIGDSIFPITFLAIIGYWELVQSARRSPSGRMRLFVQISNALLVITIVLSFLLSFSSERNRMEKFNPLLMEKLNSLFTLQY
ncbi:MAG: hypothetical protein IPP66_10065 [Anaerolineales bacterium]|nr:hypothetical protein [Anaerolineales bacterium]